MRENTVSEAELRRRLAWLLVFRGAVATLLLVLTLGADLADWPLRRISELLYGVVVGTYLVVLVLGVLVRNQVAPVILGAAHLAAAVLLAFIVVASTGGSQSPFSFLYLLAILDGAIVGGRKAALAAASAAGIAYGVGLVLQLYGALPTGWRGETSARGALALFVIHLAAFYLIALLGGHLAELWQQARRAAVSAQSSLDYIRDVHAEVLGALPVGVLTTDEQGRVRTANAAAEAILGVGSGVLQGAAIPEALRAFSEQAQPSGEVVIERHGDERHLRVHGADLSGLGLGDGRSALARVLVVEDWTAYRALEEDLRANERLASLGAMAAGLAHELRNPLAAISGAVELLQRNDDGVDPRLQQIVLREIERLNRLVEDFLAYAKPAPPELRATDLRALAEELLEVVRQDRMGKTPVRLDAPPTLVADVDPEQLRQVLWNLLRNALESSPPEQPVTLRLSEVADGVCIEVLDRGPGLSEAARQRLFEPFHTTKSGGSGLGLAVVRRIVDGHGGRVEVVNRDGGGAAAAIRLPASSGEAA